MEEEPAKVEVEAQSQKVDDTTYLMLAAYNRTKQDLSLYANREESEKTCVLNGLQSLLDIQTDEIEFKDLCPIDFMSYHDAAREAYKTVARVMVKKMGSIAIQKFQLLMHFTGKIGISIEDAITILDETKDEVSHSKGVMQDLTELDRENNNAELDREDDNTKLDQEDDNTEPDIKVACWKKSFLEGKALYFGLALNEETSFTGYRYWIPVTGYRYSFNKREKEGRRKDAVRWRERLMVFYFSLLDQLGFDQNPANKREIHCDERLKSIFDGKEKVGMMEIARLLSAHFLKYPNLTNSPRNLTVLWFLLMIYVIKVVATSLQCNLDGLFYSHKQDLGLLTTVPVQNVAPSSCFLV